MEKCKFTTEYELRSSPKVLFPYISTASGLEQWFAEKVTVLPDHRFDFQWDGSSHFARQTAHRLNKSVRFEFEDDGESSEDTNFVEMRIIDHSQSMDEAELSSLWNGLMDSLKEIVGS